MGTTKVIVSGALGRMGQSILRLCAADPEIEVVGGLESEAGIVRSRTVEHAIVPAALASSLSQMQLNRGTVLIDFSAPEATMDHLTDAARLGLCMVIGTTGLTAEDMEGIRKASSGMALVQASNMSVGVTVLLDAVEKISRSVPDYDLEIIDMHHKHKKDAPSGTAISLARAAAAGRSVSLDEHATYGRQGVVGERRIGEIAMHAVRGGDVVGEHTVIFAGEGERVEIIHRAHSRDTFASGAIRAAKFLTGKSAGLYSMKDVLGL